ncbi:MAG: mannosyltransferase [Rhodobacteraceae bacterium]|nr:mannosyltransferase [Paracoccaceae bacterium]
MVKLLGALVKLVCMVHLRLFPKARFTIPAFAPALVRRTGPRRVPRQVYQTNYGRRVGLAVYLTWQFNRLMAWDHDFHYMDDDAARDWVNAEFPGEIADTYNRLKIGAAKADYWRVLMLMKNGGVYLDADANFVWPPSSSIRADEDELFLRMRDGEITNYFLACAPGNRYMTAIEAEIRANIAAGTEKNVYLMTGPTAMLPALADGKFIAKSYRTVCHQGQFMNERLQYPDRDRKKWWREQEERSILD